MSSSEAVGLFVIDGVTGDVSLETERALDYETVSTYRFAVEAHAAGLTINCSMIVRVADLNDKPKLGSLDIYRSVWENAEVNTYLGAPVTYSDEDSGQEVTFSIVGGNIGDVFSIGACSGQLLVAKADLNFNARPLYNLTIEGNDGGVPTPLSARGHLLVHVNDTDQTPEFTLEVRAIAQLI